MGHRSERKIPIVSDSVLKGRACSLRQPRLSGGGGNSLTTVIYRRYRCVAAPTMARKRYTELVVGIVKDTPLVFVHLVSVIGKGQYTPAFCGDPKGYYLYS